jgi:hypothetical protein
LRAALIATALAVAMPCFAQEVRIITGDFEHVYGPGARRLDDADLQARNQRAWEHMQAERQLAIERRRVDIEEERLKLQAAALAYASSVDTASYDGGWDSYGGGWWGDGGFIGSTRGRFRRGTGISQTIGGQRISGSFSTIGGQRIGGSPRMGGSRR